MKILLATTAIALMATPAMAADVIDYSAPTPAPSYDVAPERFGWDGGYAGAQLGYGFAEADPGDDPSGIVGGLHAGYLMQYGSFVVGPEIDVDASGIDGEDLEIDAIARAKLKAGVAIDRFLVSGTVGYAYAWGESDTDGDVSDGALEVGAGLDFAATDNIVVGSDYMYHNFGEFDDTNSDLDLHTVRARVSYKF
ncbi:outer membrane protein [Notoacmeibacter sp. MSK16QG-6]|uniref:outer membrane protein n=1 Tax=Notoacmeibacter sp. MSK16QG-6 TaxID=2957982 RepID=UPI00209F372A|nr:outer membrane beta-barrel protein [Notoacmeibacter sp. MSK16QG-6]MCP1198898.1 outer membrane beta-barrel protein [Notoacmeibacter sp. MSK16QG-6]